MTPARRPRPTTSRRPRSSETAHSRNNQQWRPTWDDYADVVMAMTEVEVMSFMARTIHASSTPPLILTKHTARALARAGLIGDQPGWRRALLASFRWVDRKEITQALISLQIALRAGCTPLNPKYGILVRRSMAACKRLGFSIPGDQKLAPPPRPIVSSGRRCQG